MRMTSVRIKFIFTFFSLLTICSAFAEKAPMKLFKVDMADLEMKVYPADSSAAAVVLCDYGYFDPQLFKFVHQIRIKILKEEGKARGDFFVPAAERTTVRGQTVNLENGVPVVTKLNKESIFIEKIMKNYYRARVAMPNVKVGSVIDVEFYYEGAPATWSFQETIPVRWSEYQENNNSLTFSKSFVGYNPLTISTPTRWVAKDVPALKTEQFINNINNYLTHFDIELTEINLIGYHAFRPTTWESVANTLRTDNAFGMHFKTISFYLNGIENQIKATTKTPEEQLIKAYESVKCIKWNKTETYWPSEIGLELIFNRKLGNVADINMTLIILLRKLGIEANPVLLSTRDNGLIQPRTVSMTKLNYLVVQAEIGDKKYLLDATEDNLPAGILPERALNERGFLIKDNSGEWIDLTAQKKDKSVLLFNLKLSPEGVMSGNLNKSCYDYAALNQRNKYKSFNSQDEYLKGIESKYIGFSVDNYKLSDLDSLQKPLKEDFSITLKNRITKTNSKFFINPIQIDRITENPFKMEQRIYPVDFTTPIERTQVFRLELPVGFSVEQLPANIKMNLPGNTANFQMQSNVSENIVQVLFKLNINKPVFNQDEYSDLKAFYDQLVKKQSEMLIIKKD